MDRKLEKPGRGGMGALFECVECKETFPRVMEGQVKCIKCLEKDISMQTEISETNKE